jgi:hypothetical protein
MGCCRPEGQGSGKSLAAMFEPPREMLFRGSFEEAKQILEHYLDDKWELHNEQFE